MSAPLTTTFTPPASCAAQWTALASGPVTLVKFVSESDYSSVSTCYPSGIIEGADEPVYSPGLICPSGYTTATQETLASNSFVDFCCPSGFTYESENLTCTTSFTSTVVYSIDANGGTHSSTFKSGYAWAEPVQLQYALADLPLTATTTSARTATGAATSSSNTNPTLFSPHSSSGLSSGAKAGIAVGVILAVALVALGLFLVLRHRRRRMRPGMVGSDVAPTATESMPEREPEEKQVVEHPTPHRHVSELHGRGRDHTAELYSREVHELPGAPTPDAELPGSEPVFQLDADEVGGRAHGSRGSGRTGLDGPGSPTLGAPR